MITLEANEVVLLTARKHWFIFASEILVIILFAAVPFALFLIPAALLENFIGTVRFEGNPAMLFLFFWSLWLFLLWIVAALFWTDYYLDVWLVTNHRVIDVDQRGMFNRRVNSFRYDQIQDATVVVPGIVPTLIGFGTVELRTASEETFRIKGVANPNILRERILSEHHRVHGG